MFRLTDMNLLEFSHYPYFTFKSEDELTTSQFFMTLSTKEKKEICAKVADAPVRGENSSMILKEEIEKNFNERKEKNMHLTNTTANAVISGVCLRSGSTNVATAKCANSYNDYDSVIRYPSEPREGLFGGNPAINGVAFGPNDEVYLMICGQRCEIYPNDDSGRVEVELIRNLDIQEFVKTYQEKHGKRIPGGKIKRLQKALIKWRHMLAPFSTKQFNGPSFDRILFHGRATVLLSDKNDKTVVKCMDGESYDPEKALLTALFIREYGKNAYHDLMDICHETYVECGEPNKPKSKKKTAKKAVSKTKNR